MTWTIRIKRKQHTFRLPEGADAEDADAILKNGVWTEVTPMKGSIGSRKIETEG